MIGAFLSIFESLPKVLQLVGIGKYFISEPLLYLQLKYTKDFKAMEKSCEKALKQIKDRRYQEYLLNDNRQNIMYYGIAFCRKRCKVLVERYNGDSEPDKA